MKYEKDGGGERKISATAEMSGAFGVGSGEHLPNLFFYCRFRCRCMPFDLLNHFKLIINY